MKIKMLLILVLCGMAHVSGAQTEYTTIMDRIRAELLSQASNTTTLDNNVTSTLATLQANGSWPDVSYAYSATTYTADVHINRVKTFAQAYTKPGSSYYQSSTLFNAIVSSLTYWDTADPQSWNWYHNQISNPQRIGEILILLETAPASLGTLRASLLAQMNRGNPSAQTGANKLDVATHFMYRACLTANDSLMQYGVDQIFYPLVLTTAEGIQHDNSYQQHGPQLYIYGYGSVFVEGETKMAYYLRGTSYALSGTRLNIFSNFVRNGFLKAMRGKYIDYGTNGRSISRENNLAVGVTAHLEKLKVLDTANVTEYNQNIARLNGTQAPGYQLPDLHTHFWRSDYSLHHRSGYLFGLHLTSTRTAKQENGNGENLKGYYLSDGSTHIAMSGSEYYNIPPVWDWSRIPGTTVPYITTIPLRTSWGVNFGTTAFAGGVSDSLYGVSALQFSDYGTQARKAWFFFDKEVVCLGAGITSTATQPINTTVNQCLLNGSVSAKIGGAVSTVADGSYTYNNNLKWISHNGVGYYFPNGGQLQLTMQSQSGTWRSINNGGSTTVQNMNVFTLWFNHGTTPSNGNYAYYVLPGQDMNTYDTTAVRVYQNTSAMQVVYHAGLNIWQMVFYQAGTFHQDSVTVTVDRPCALLLKQVGSSNVQVAVADPAQSSLPVNIHFNLPGISQTRLLTAAMPSGAYAGSTVQYNVNASTPIYSVASVSAVADAYVRGGSAYAGVNYGTGSLVLKQDASISYTREIFLKFNVNALPAGTNQVKLRMYVNYANTSIATVPWILQYVSNDSWTESGITYNNMPAVSAAVDTIMGRAAGNYAEWDVTNIALSQQAGDGVLSLKLVSGLAGATTDAIFPSRDGADSTQRPVLLCNAENTALSMLAFSDDKLSGTSIYPNPAEKFIRVTSDKQWLQAEIRDANGKLLKLVNVARQNGGQFEIPLDNVQPGMYMLVLRGKGKQMVKKIVKM
ncbi:polysaccharide lyase family 8 super-sandwich domain-containing protein [Chitinophaga sp. sic0106]|uniref:polysaccharide lyase family 8 super-sandwich domain-containing protein n=1 Tax=Chitinophaga sp. sic0106 TaxID=2854785 RepID=UPI001C451422|nr:polysaccharide lyase family 8 super-sandwich domain-containing protein [Chitinophaga sp. sic0106]MBV7530242.1 DNRLRE domain-containing protein [Chitinophaga sp. sic0106]